ncbi:hypothetical protein FGG90_15610 (plasmid) [Clavibacter tessellarius]|uniref:Uncharacterized protein n=1 Tax=Clavibacter tessellarius TaxID=31965 RepID=A0A225CGC5_9MICO|nr:hypothetical protein [Clavibacter michiganensis]OQJ61443.1 hypothetical protein B5P24_15615 [Clavibacter michiganensis subsp. tessellarius]UKF35505.1 hypothetical protein FGG90_15610 [Clavibacter michiganensis subsp. tessellarius]
MPDILDADAPEPVQTPRQQRRARRASKKADRRATVADQRSREQQLRRRAFGQDRSPWVLGIGGVLVFGGIAVVGALVPAEQDAPSSAPALHAAATPTSAPTAGSAAPSPAAAPVAEPATVGANWAVAYFSGQDWQSLTAPAAREALAAQRGQFFDGTYLTGDRVNVAEWTWRDESTSSPQWEGTIDVLLQPGRQTRLSATFRMTIDTTGATPVVTRVETVFYGEA